MARSSSVLAVVLLVGLASPARAEAPVYRVNVEPPAKCAVGAPCEARLKLTALGGYKVNAEYPSKFVVDPGSPVTIQAGKLVRDTEKTGTLTLAVTPKEAGTARVTGTFKLSVCTKDVCKIEKAKIAFAVPAT